MTNRDRNAVTAIFMIIAALVVASVMIIPFQIIINTIVLLALAVVLMKWLLK